MGLSNELPSRLARVVFAGMMVLTWSGGVRGAQPQASGSSAEAAQRVEKCFNAIEAVKGDIPRETFDVSAVVRQAGDTPQAMLDWVRGRTVWIPYQGSLRGPLGVLMDRRGNGLDRAMLLAEMLRTAGKAARLAHATRSDAQVAEVRKAIAQQPQTMPATRPEDGRSMIDLVLQKYIEPAGLDIDAMRREAEGLLARSERTTEEIAGRTVNQSKVLAEMIGVSKDESNPDDHINGALRDHWWVQYQEGGNWVNLDPGGREEDSALTPADTIDWQPRDGHWPIDAAMRHEIELRLVIERWEAGRLSEQTVLRQTLVPSELMGQYISLLNMPKSWPTGLNLAAEANPSAKIKALTMDEHEWMPVLRVGTQAFYEGSFTDTGSVNPKADMGLFKSTGRSIGGAANSAADMLSGAAEPPQDDGILTAEWIEYEIRSPGRPPQTIRRQLFDLIGPAARSSQQPVAQPKLDDSARLNRGLMLIGQTEILPLVCQLSPAFVDELTAQRALLMRDSLVKLTGASETPAIKEASDSLTSLSPVPGQLYDLALMRGLLGPHQNDIYLDRPNILSFHQFMRTDPGGDLKFVSAIDIVSNEIGVQPTGNANQTRQVRMAQGVLDTAAETLLLDQSVRTGSASDLLASHGDADQWLVVRNSEDSQWRQVQVSADLRARVDAELAKGYAVVLPRQLPAGDDMAAVWWRIDPGTGRTLGMNGYGWGAAMVEYAVTGLVFLNACLIGAVAAKTKSPHKSVILCALGALGFGAGAAAGATAFTLALLIAAAAGGGAAGGSF